MPQIVSTTSSASQNNASTTKKSLNFYLAFVGLTATVFVFQMDVTALGTAIPTISQELHGTSLEAFWASISYSLSVIVTQLQWAAFSDVFGRKTPLLLSNVFFAAGSLTFALAPNMRTLIAGRVLQGIGGGGIDVLAEVILADMTTLEERSLWLSYMGIPIAIGNIMGPIISALFTAYLSWRWLGWLNLPFLGISFPLIIIYLQLRPVDPDTTLLQKLRRLDWLGMMMFTIGITAFVLPLSWAGSLYPWSSWRTYLPLIFGVIIIALFLYYENYPTYPMVPLRLLKSRTALSTLAGALFHGICLSAILQYLPLVYQSVHLQSVMGSAVSMIPATITSVVAAVAAMGLVTIAGGGYTWAISISWIILTTGSGILTLLNEDSDRSSRQGLPVLWGMGIALLRLLLLPMQASVENIDDTGPVTSLLLFTRFLGTLLGLSIASTAFTTKFLQGIQPILPNLQGIFHQLKDANQAIAFIPELRETKSDISQATLRQVRNVYLESFRLVFYVMTGFSAAGFVTSLFTRELTMKRTEASAQAFQENKDKS